MDTLVRRGPRIRLAVLVPFLVALTLGLAACSPEGSRERGSGAGSGADPDNRDPEVELHGDVQQDDRIYYRTPNRTSAER